MTQKTDHIGDTNKMVTMKLYTEENVRYMLGTFHTHQINIELCMLKLTPIELPSDEDILIERFNSDVFINNVCLSYRHDFGFLAEQDKQALIFECKEWMRAIYNNWKHHKEQILNQNKS